MIDILTAKRDCIYIKCIDYLEHGSHHDYDCRLKATNCTHCSNYKSNGKNSGTSMDKMRAYLEEIGK